MRFFSDFKKYFHYIIYATRSQLKSQVANSYLDWIWWILEPFCNMVVYTIIFGYVFNVKEDYFPIFVFIGVSMWGFFDRTLKRSVGLVKGKKAIVTKVYIPKTILLIVQMTENAFKMLLSFMIIFAMMAIWKVPINHRVLYFFPVLGVMFVFTYGVSCFLMHYGVYIEDLEYIVSILLRMAMYFTGIFYSVEKRIPKPWGHILSTYNPMAFLITSMRNALLYKTGHIKLAILVWLMISLILAGLGTRLIYKRENSYVKVI